MTKPNDSPRQRLLVADDDGLVLATLTTGLQEHGYEVVAAASGEEAVELCKQQQPDLAILDMRMPGMSGIEAARIIFSECHVPFMFLSAFDDEKIVDEAVNEGALGYLVKPVDVRKIVPSIEAALRRATEIDDLKHKEMHLSHALSSGRETSVAIGLLMTHGRLNAEQAEQALRDYARNQRRKMSEIASEIITATEAINAVLSQTLVKTSEKD